MQLSEHFTLDELKKTTWNFPNDPVSQDAIHLELQFEAIRQSDIPYDQLILEFGWIHCSHSPDGHQRRQALIVYKDGGKISYKAAL